MKKFIINGQNSDVLKMRNWMFKTSGVTVDNYLDCPRKVPFKKFQENCERLKSFTSKMDAENAAKYLLSHEEYYDSCDCGDIMLSVVPLKDSPTCYECWIKMSDSSNIIAAFFSEHTDAYDIRCILDSIALGIL